MERWHEREKRKPIRLSHSAFSFTPAVCFCPHSIVRHIYLFFFTYLLLSFFLLSLSIALSVHHLLYFSSIIPVSFASISLSRQPIYPSFFESLFSFSSLPFSFILLFLFHFAFISCTPIFPFFSLSLSLCLSLSISLSLSLSLISFLRFLTSIRSQHIVPVFLIPSSLPLVSKASRRRSDIVEVL